MIGSARITISGLAMRRFATTVAARTRRLPRRASDLRAILYRRKRVGRRSHWRSASFSGGERRPDLL